MKDFSNQLKKVMKIRGISQTELCDRTGIPKSAMSQYISGAFKPKQERVYLLAKALRTTPEYLMGLTDDEEPPVLFSFHVDNNNAEILPDKYLRRIPTFESCAAGFGAYADSTITGYQYLSIQSDWEAEHTIAVKVKGDSMYPKIEDGDIVIVCKDMDYEDGQIVVARIGDDEAVVKRIHLFPDKLVLESINPEYMDRVFRKEQMNSVHIEGVVKKIIKNV
ncbi:MAG: XRE family transcriptional regulator [Oscillospiraceae bacterium]|nr:XRE family transcriptional regulator [Oscillospiraceae bacterium]